MSNRRIFFNQTAIGLFGILPLTSQFEIIGKNQLYSGDEDLGNNGKVHPLYPSTDQAIIRDVVGAAHGDFDALKELVTARPELAKASYDWGFGDVESAIGAASHMGRKDIAEFLIEHGARPNLFTFAMLGKIKSVKSMIEEMPGIQKIPGPHGLTLLFHARMRLLRKNVEGAEKEEQEAVVAYLESIGDADVRATSLDITDDEKKIFLGKYTFGEGEDESFDVSLNSREQLYMSRGEQIGRALNRVDTYSFAPGGAPSVRIVFEVQDGEVKALTIHDPTPLLKALRV